MAGRGVDPQRDGDRQSEASLPVRGRRRCEEEDEAASVSARGGSHRRQTEVVAPEVGGAEEVAERRGNRSVARWRRLHR